MIFLVFCMISDFLNWNLVSLHIMFWESVSYLYCFSCLFLTVLHQRKERFTVSLWLDGVRNIVFPLGLHGPPFKLGGVSHYSWEGRGVPSPHWASTATSLRVVDIHCYCSPHGSTNTTDGVASLPLSGGECPDFPVPPPLPSPHWQSYGHHITSW